MSNALAQATITRLEDQLAEAQEMINTLKRQLEESRAAPAPVPASAPALAPDAGMRKDATKTTKLPILAPRMTKVPQAIHNLMVGENRDDVQLFQGLTQEDMLMNFLAQAAQADDPESDLEDSLREELRKGATAAKRADVKGYGALFVLPKDDSVLYQYVVTKIV